MINKINENIFFSKSNSVEFQYFLGDVTIALSLDSNSRVFSYKYQIKNNAPSLYYEFLGHVIIDQEIDQLLYGLVELAEENLTTELSDILDDTLKLDLAILTIREALYRYKGEVRELTEVNGVNPNELICLCNSIDRSGVKKLFVDHSGNENEMMLNSNLSLICGGCRPLFKKELTGISEELEFESVQTALVDFAMVSPPDFNDIIFELKASSLPKVDIQINANPEKISRDRIGETLQSYLQSELKNKLVVLCLNNRPEL